MIEPINTFYPKNKAEWRSWLEKNHDSDQPIWLIYNKAASKVKNLSHAEAIEEALCFGWIDAKGQSIDEFTFRVTFTKRKAKSIWSKINKDTAQRLIDQGLMKEAGLATIETAKQNGYWTIMDDAEALIIPPDLEKEFSKYPDAKIYFESLSKSIKKSILQWLILAKRTETRKNRIDEVVTLAREKKKPKQF